MGGKLMSLPPSVEATQRQGPAAVEAGGADTGPDKHAHLLPVRLGVSVEEAAWLVGVSPSHARRKCLDVPIEAGGWYEFTVKMGERRVVWLEGLRWWFRNELRRQHANVDPDIFMAPSSVDARALPG